MLRILTEHIEKVCSLESELFLLPLCSIRILYILELIAKTSFTQINPDLGYVEHPKPKARRRNSAQKITKPVLEVIAKPESPKPDISEPENGEEKEDSNELNEDDMAALNPAVSTFDDSMLPPLYEEPKTDTESEFADTSEEENFANEENFQEIENKEKVTIIPPPEKEETKTEVQKSEETKEEPEETKPEIEEKETKKPATKRRPPPQRKRAPPKAPAKKPGPKPGTKRTTKPKMVEVETQTEVTVSQMINDVTNVIQKSVNLLVEVSDCEQEKSYRKRFNSENISP